MPLSSQQSDTEVGSTVEHSIEQPKAYFLACFQLCVLETVRQKLRCCPDEFDGVTKMSIVRFLEKQLTDYVSGDIESQVITALKELTASKVLRITESGAYLIVHRYIPNIAFGDDLKLSNVTTGLSRKRPASDTSVIFVEENRNDLEEESTVPTRREVKAGRRKGLLKKLNRN